MVVAAKLHRMHLDEPTLTVDDLAGIAGPTLVMGGDHDEVTLEHLVATYRGIPQAELAILPRTGHGVLSAEAELCNAMIVDFLTAEAAGDAPG